MITGTFHDAWTNRAGQPCTTRTPAAGDTLSLATYDGRPQLYKVDYVVAERVSDGKRYTACGISWPLDAPNADGIAWGATTITVESNADLGTAHVQ